MAEATGAEKLENIIAAGWNVQVTRGVHDELKVTASRWADMGTETIQGNGPTLAEAVHRVHAMVMAGVGK